MLDLRRLSYLVAVAEAGTVSAAARQMRVAQPAVSRQLRVLERTLNVTLFEKQGRNLVLTSAGRRTVELARALLRQVAETEAAAQQIAHGVAARLLVAASITTINEIAAPALARLDRKGPHVDFVVCLPDRAVGALDDAADLALGGPSGSLLHECREIGRIPIFAQFVDIPAWAGRSKLHISEVVEQPLILLNHNHLARRRIDESLSEGEVGYSRYVECAVPKGAQALAAAGCGVALLTDFPNFGVQVIPLIDNAGPLEIRMFASWESSHFATNEISRLVEAISGYYHDRLVATAGSGGLH